jgi:hypothetical protein
MYTVAELKKQYKNFKAAKQHFNITARGWETLCQKLNAEYSKDIQIQKLEAEIDSLKVKIAKLTARSDLDILLTDLVYPRGVGSNEVFESSEALLDEPEKTGKDDWAYFESTLKRRYYRLSNRYHPDKGGTDEQFRNLEHAYQIARTFVKENGGIGQ